MISSSPKKIAKGSIHTYWTLCTALTISRREMMDAIKLKPADRYTPIERPKSDGSIRVVYRPHRLIRKIQRRINRRIFANSSVLRWPDHLYGSVPNQADEKGNVVEKDYIACAKNHCGAKSLLKLDIKDFFDNVHDSIVLDIFIRFFKYPAVVAKILTNICTHENRIVQGALTSSYLANLCLYDVEAEVVSRLKRKGLAYTRLVDDMSVSSKKSDYDFEYALSLITSMLISKGLPLNVSKMRQQYVSTEPLVVHGLRISFKEPRLPSDEVGRIRSSVRNLEALASEGNYRTSHSYRHDFNRCMGRVNKLKRVGHTQHGGLMARLRRIYPLPSKKDVERAYLLIARLEKDFSGKSETFGYAKRSYVLADRLNVLQRSFPNIANDIRIRLRLVRTSYAP